MSEPILIVVVVMDVVFVKENVRSKKILVRKIHVQINFRQNIFGSKRFRSKKVVVQKIMVQKNLGSKKILVKISGSKNLSKKKFK